MDHPPAGPPILTRFAPSPSGHLHVGGARTALFNWAFARGRGGRFLLRIEDTDRRRSSEAASLGFLEDLAWLGIGWDEGPEHRTAEGQAIGGGERGPYFQSERLAIYEGFLTRLLESGRAYLAFDTPEALDAARAAARHAGRAYRYDRSAALAIDPAERSQRVAAGEAAVIRFRVPDDRAVTIRDEILGEVSIPPGEIEDFVIRKADGFPTYHFAVVVDDELMGVTHVLRAQEHFNNTAKHILLQEALGFRTLVYGHLPLIFNPEGSKMSKRDKDRTLREAVSARGLEHAPVGADGTPLVDEATFAQWRCDKSVQLPTDTTTQIAEALGVPLPEINIDDFRRSGYLPEVLVNFLALNGWSPGHDLEKFDAAFLCDRFSLDRVVKTPARFDRAKLLAFNLDAIQAMPPETFLARLRAHGEHYHPAFLAAIGEAGLGILAAASQPRCKTLDEPFRGNAFLVADDDAIAWERSKPVEKALFKGEPSGVALLDAASTALAVLPQWTTADLETTLAAIAERHAGGQLGKIAQPLRIAVTGGTVSPPIHDTLVLLGRERTLNRLRRCLAWASAAAS